MKTISAPFEAWFSMAEANTPYINPHIVAHNLPDMLARCERAMRYDDRFRGYIQVRNSAGLIVIEINVLGRVPH